MDDSHSVDTTPQLPTLHMGVNALAPGSACLIGPLKETCPIPATVVAVCLYDSERVSYQVAWWDGRSRRCEWLESCEVKPAKNSPLKTVGFRLQGGTEP